MRSFLARRARFHRARGVVVVLAISIASAVVAAPVWAGDQDGPIELTNDDVVRLHAPTGDSSEATRGAATTAQSAPAVVYDVDRQAKTTSTQTMNAARRKIDGKVGSWQDEYYRLKAMALRDAIARGETIDFQQGQDAGPAGAPPASPASAHGSSAAATSAPRSTGGACIYGIHGKLIHTPPGMECDRYHRSYVGNRPVGSSRQDAPSGNTPMCVYGSRGQLLFEADDAECPATKAK